MKKYTFANYMTYKGNMMAYTTLLAAANSQERDVNPLYIHGSAGLGKTHLVSAAFASLMELTENLTVMVTSGERFSNDLIYALCHRNYQGFMNGCKEADVFIVDDLHLITSDEAQSAFHEIVDELLTKEKKLIMTSNVPPEYLTHFSNGLLSKIADGYVVELEAPCFDIRVRIVKNEMKNLLSGRTLQIVEADQEKIYSLIACSEASDIGKIKKMVSRLVSFAALLNEKIDYTFAKRILLHNDKMKDL